MGRDRFVDRAGLVAGTCLAIGIVALDYSYGAIYRIRRKWQEVSLTKLTMVKSGVAHRALIRDMTWINNATGTFVLHVLRDGTYIKLRLGEVVYRPNAMGSAGLLNTMEYRFTPVPLPLEESVVSHTTRFVCKPWPNFLVCLGVLTPSVGGEDFTPVAMGWREGNFVFTAAHAVAEGSDLGSCLDGGTLVLARPDATGAFKYVVIRVTRDDITYALDSAPPSRLHLTGVDICCLRMPCVAGGQPLIATQLGVKSKDKYAGKAVSMATVYGTLESGPHSCIGSILQNEGARMRDLGVYLHSCNTLPSFSGGPIIMCDNGVDKIAGMHLGSHCSGEGNLAATVPALDALRRKVGLIEHTTVAMLVMRNALGVVESSAPKDAQEDFDMSRFGELVRSDEFDAMVKLRHYVSKFEHRASTSLDRAEHHRSLDASDVRRAHEEDMAHRYGDGEGTVTQQQARDARLAGHALQRQHAADLLRYQPRDGRVAWADIESDSGAEAGIGPKQPAFAAKQPPWPACAVRPAPGLQPTAPVAVPAAPLQLPLQAGAASFAALQPTAPPPSDLSSSASTAPTAQATDARLRLFNTMLARANGVPSGTPQAGCFGGAEDRRYAAAMSQALMSVAGEVLEHIHSLRECPMMFSWQWWEEGHLADQPVAAAVLLECQMYSFNLHGLEYLLTPDWRCTDPAAYIFNAKLRVGGGTRQSLPMGAIESADGSLIACAIERMCDPGTFSAAVEMMQGVSFTSSLPDIATDLVGAFGGCVVDWRRSPSEVFLHCFLFDTVMTIHGERVSYQEVPGLLHTPARLTAAVPGTGFILEMPEGDGGRLIAWLPGPVADGTTAVWNMAFVLAEAGAAEALERLLALCHSIHPDLVQCADADAGEAHFDATMGVVSNMRRYAQEHRDAIRTAEVIGHRTHIWVDGSVLRARSTLTNVRAGVFGPPPLLQMMLKLASAADVMRHDPAYHFVAATRTVLDQLHRGVNTFGCAPSSDPSVVWATSLVPGMQRTMQMVGLQPALDALARTQSAAMGRYSHNAGGELIATEGVVRYAGEARVGPLPDDAEAILRDLHALRAAAFAPEEWRLASDYVEMVHFARPSMASLGLPVDVDRARLTRLRDHCSGLLLWGDVTGGECGMLCATFGARSEEAAFEAGRFFDNFRSLPHFADVSVYFDEHTRYGPGAYGACRPLKKWWLDDFSSTDNLLVRVLNQPRPPLQLSSEAPELEDLHSQQRLRGASSTAYETTGMSMASLSDAGPEVFQAAADSYFAGDISALHTMLACPFPVAVELWHSLPQLAALRDYVASALPGLTTIDGEVFADSAGDPYFKVTGKVSVHPRGGVDKRISPEAVAAAGRAGVKLDPGYTVPGNTQANVLTSLRAQAKIQVKGSFDGLGTTPSMAAQLKESTGAGGPAGKGCTRAAVNMAGIKEIINSVVGPYLEDGGVAAGFLSYADVVLQANKLIDSFTAKSSGASSVLLNAKGERCITKAMFRDCGEARLQLVNIVMSKLFVRCMFNRALGVMTPMEMVKFGIRDVSVGAIKGEPHSSKKMAEGRLRILWVASAADVVTSWLATKQIQKHVQRIYQDSLEADCHRAGLEVPCIIGLGHHDDGLIAITAAMLRQAHYNSLDGQARTVLIACGGAARSVVCPENMETAVLHAADAQGWDLSVTRHTLLAAYTAQASMLCGTVRARWLHAAVLTLEAMAASAHVIQAGGHLIEAVRAGVVDSGGAGTTLDNTLGRVITAKIASPARFDHTRHGRLCRPRATGDDMVVAGDAPDTGVLRQMGVMTKPGSASSSTIVQGLSYTSHLFQLQRRDIGSREAYDLKVNYENFDKMLARACFHTKAPSADQVCGMKYHLRHTVVDNKPASDVLCAVLADLYGVDFSPLPAVDTGFDEDF